DVNLRRLDQAFADVPKVRWQAPDQVGLFEYRQVAPHGVMCDPESGTELRGVEDAPLPVREHGEQAAHQQRVGADFEGGKVSFGIRPQVPSPPPPEVDGAQRVREPAPQPSLWPRTALAAARHFDRRQRVEIENTDTPCQGFRDSPYQRRLRR